MDGRYATNRVSTSGIKIDYFLQRDDQGDTPLHQAVRTGDQSLLEALLFKLATLMQIQEEPAVN